MQILFSEHNKDYGSYTFDYAVYAIMENRHELPEIYAKGFLPYSNDLRDDREVFYLARSLRVELSSFSDSSENRRVDRKLNPLELSLKVTPKKDFDLEESYFIDLCNAYARDRFSGNAMTKERFDYILRRKIFSHVFSFNTADDIAVGYVFTLVEGNTLHYWYSFFDHHKMKDYPLGKWLMWRSIRWAFDEGLEYVYLGTCYGDKALYKVRDFKGLSFFDGQSWNKDMTLLKQWCKSDDQPLKLDRFKLASENKNN